MYIIKVEAHFDIQQSNFLNALYLQFKKWSRNKCYTLHAYTIEFYGHIPMRIYGMGLRGANCKPNTCVCISFVPRVNNSKIH